MTFWNQWNHWKSLELLVLLELLELLKLLELFELLELLELFELLELLELLANPKNINHSLTHNVKSRDASASKNHPVHVFIEVLFVALYFTTC